jgi:hypothetical protein
MTFYFRGWHKFATKERKKEILLPFAVLYYSGTFLSKHAFLNVSSTVANDFDAK